MQPRIFFPDLQQGEFALDQENSHHLARVLRVRPGDSVTLFNGQGQEAQAKVLSIEKMGVRLAADCPAEIRRESPLRIELIQALCTGDKMDWVVQKATELGAAKITPISAQRSVLKLDGPRAEKRLSHWRAIAKAASAQCGRNIVPEVCAVQSLGQAIESWRSTTEPKTGWLLDPFAGAPLSAAALAGPLTFMIGPEAGWSDAEEAQARSAGFVGVRCGPRILRTETAASVVLSAVAMRVGEF